jgi:hypothetical protein
MGRLGRIDASVTSAFLDFQRFPNSREHVALGHTTSVAFIDSCSKHGKIRFVFLFFTFQSPHDHSILTLLPRSQQFIDLHHQRFRQEWLL